MTRTVIVLAKTPRPGFVKTRLCPPLTIDEAALLARAALDDTLDAVRAATCTTRVLMVDEPVPWLRPSGFRIARQSAGGLADRLDAAFAAIAGPTVLVGMDTPQLTAADLDDALDRLREPDDAVLGRADDGGFWAVGLHRSHPSAFSGVPMSQDDTGARQFEALRRAGRVVHELPALRDVDRCGDALEVAAAAPSTRFAQLVGELALAARESTP